MKPADRIYRLRMDAGMTQEAFAALFGVSKQSVQKWETGASLPSSENLIAIAERFGISLDALMLGRDKRAQEGMAQASGIPKPSYKLLSSALPSALYSGEPDCEYQQLRDEGKDVAQYEKLFAAVQSLPIGAAREELADTLFAMTTNLEQVKGYPYVEPSDPDGIKRLCVPYEAAGTVPDDDALFDKIYGAWVGRVGGCFLGKPLEGVRYRDLVPILKETGNYPLGRFLKESELSEDLLARHGNGWALRSRFYEDCLGENDCMPPDDDTNYTVLAVHILDKHGRDFTPEDVAYEWLCSQPVTAYATAENVAVRNFVNGFLPPMSAVYKNPYREYIGAQIRADVYGYVNPGDPQAAADMAFRDASISHVKNGIYGAMYVAAMIATAAKCSDPVEIVKSGMGVIPATSRLYEALGNVLGAFSDGEPCEKIFADLREKRPDTDGYHWCHVISNCIIVTAALLYGGGDYGKSICLAVGAAYDTDCNGATVGSLLGMMNGIGGIGEQWKSVVRDRLATNIVSHSEISIRAYAEKTMRFLRKG